MSTTPIYTREKTISKAEELEILADMLEKANQEVAEAEKVINREGEEPDRIEFFEGQLERANKDVEKFVAAIEAIQNRPTSATLKAEIKSARETLKDLRESIKGAEKSERRAILGEIEDLKERLEDLKEELKEREQEEREDEKLQHKKDIERFIKEYDLYHVADGDVFVKYLKEEGTLVYIRRSGIVNHYPALRKEWVYTLFLEVLDDLNRNKINMRPTFRDLPDTTMNMMRTDHWVKPVNRSKVKRNYSEWFDILMRSLSNGKKENWDHIEQVVYWKRYHPEDTLPCIVWYGEGGAGKNLFVEHVLGAMFGYNQATSTDSNQILGDFTDAITGKTVVYIDEAVDKKIDFEKLKSRVNNPTFTANPKGRPAFQCDNTAMYMMGSNKYLGSFKLQKDKTDRRWSVMKLPPNRDLEYYVGQHFGTDDRGEIHAKLSDAVKNVYTNPEEVGLWLDYLRGRWGKMERAPQRLHGEDYQELCSLQSSAHEEAFEFIFDRDEFEFITLQGLTSVYKIFADETGTEYKLGRNGLLGEALKWLGANKPGVEYNPKHNVMIAGKRTSKGGFGIPKSGNYDFKDDKFVKVSEYGKWELVEKKPDRGHLKLID